MPNKNQPRGKMMPRPLHRRPQPSRHPQPVASLVQKTATSQVLTINDGKKLTVPTLIGLPMRRVVEAASAAGLDVQIIGNGTARERASRPRHAGPRRHENRRALRPLTAVPIDLRGASIRTKMGAPSKLCWGGKATNPTQPRFGLTIELKAMEAAMESFAGKVALVTGGSSGIGKATALAFAKGGANVVIAARGEQMGTQTVDEITAAGGKAILVPTMYPSPRMWNGSLRALSATQKYSDAWTAHSTTQPTRTDPSKTDLTEENFDKSVSINLKSVWLGMKYEIRQMLAQEPRGGVIVNTSSANGLGGCPQASFYAAAKARVIALSKSAAWEYAQQGVRIDASRPGAFRTPMLEGSIDRAAAGDPKPGRRLKPNGTA